MAESLARAIEHHKLYSEVMDGCKRRIMLCQMQLVRYEQIVLSLALWHVGAAIMSETVEARSQPDFHLMATSAEDFPRILDLRKEGKVKNFDSILLFDKPKPEDVKAAEELKLKIYLYEDLIKEGKNYKDAQLIGSGRDDICAIIDTSGTSGVDKSVMFSNYLLLYIVWYTCGDRLAPGGVYQQFEDSYSSGTLAAAYCAFCVGSGVAIKSHVFSVLDDIQSSQPDYVVMYSNGYQGAYLKMMEYLKTFPKEDKERIEKALAKKIEYMNHTKQLVHPELDKELLPLRENMFGKNLKTLLAGGAPLAPGILYSIRAVAAVPFDLIYGQTETGLITLSETGDLADCIGPPVKMRKVKLADIPKMGYLTADCTDGKPTPRGEVLLLFN